MPIEKKIIKTAQTIRELHENWEYAYHLAYLVDITTQNNQNDVKSAWTAYSKFLTEKRLTKVYELKPLLNGNEIIA